MVLAGADEGAAAAAAADEFDDPGPAFAFEVGEGEFLPCARERAAIEAVRLLAVGDEAVEIEVGVELALLRLEKVERVELENLHDELRRVFDDHIERDVIARQELWGVCGRKFDVHAVFERLKLRGRDERGPALGIADAIRDQRLGEDGLQPGVADVLGPRGEECWSSGVLFRLGGEEVEEVVADKFFVVVDGRRTDERIAEVGVEVAPVGVVGAEELLVDVGQAARELQVGEEALAIIDALFAVVIEAEVKNAGFEGLVRFDACREGPYAVEPGLALGFVEFEVHIGAGGQFAQVGVDEAGAPAVLGFQFIELREQKLAMNRQIAKTDERLRFEVRIQRGDEVRHIGALELLQHGAALIRRERHLIANERRERVLREALEAAVVVQGIAQEDLAADFGRIEAGGQVGLRIRHLALVIVADAEALDEVFQRALRVLLVAEDGLAIQNDAARLVFVRRALPPLVEQVVELRGVADVLIMQRVEEIILLRARHEFPEGLFPIRRESEALNEADFVFGEGREGQEEGKEERFHDRRQDKGPSMTAEGRFYCKGRVKAGLGWHLAVLEASGGGEAGKNAFDGWREAATIAAPFPPPPSLLWLKSVKSPASASLAATTFIAAVKRRRKAVSAVTSPSA